MNNLIKPRKLKGFRDCMGREIRLRSQIIQILQTAASRFCFETMDTPALEYREVLLGEGGETDKQVYGFEDQGGRQVVMRYDLTVPLARFAAESQGKFHLPLRRFQLGKVWRAEKPQKGRYREFMQGDFDILGVPGAESELEILTIVAWCLAEIPGPVYVIRLGHRQLLTALCHRYFQLEPGTEKPIFIILDKLAKVGIDAVVVMLEEYLSSLNQPGSHSRAFAETVMLTDIEKIKEAVGEAASPEGEYSKVLDVFEELERIKYYLSQQFDPAQVRFEIDLSLARGLDYYTGMVFETDVALPVAESDQVQRLTSVGSVCSGGLYTNLVSRFSKTPVAGVGASLGIDRLISVLMEVLPLSHPFNQSKAQVVFLVCDLKQPQAMQWMMMVALRLRTAGLSVSHVLVYKNIQKQYQQAARMQARWAVFLELAMIQADQSSLNMHHHDAAAYDIWQHPVTIKDLSSQQQVSTSLSELMTLVEDV